MVKYELLSCVWELTLLCNLRCIHCGSTAGKKREDELSLDESYKIIDDLKKTGCKSIALMGGEPLIYKDFWNIARRIKEKGIELCVITNGTIFSKDTFIKLKELRPRAIATSIDGANPKTHDKIRGVNGCFDKTMAFINKALYYDLPVSVITTVSKINISELNDIKDILLNKKIAWQIQIAGGEGGRFNKDLLLNEEEFYSVGVFIDYIRSRYSVKELPVIGAHDIGYNSRIIKQTSLYKEWDGCQAGISVIGIRSNGDVLGCLSINDDRFVEGNIRKKSIYDIWNDENSFSYTRKFKKKYAGNNCKDCRYIEKCKGGCSEMSLMKTGCIHNDPYCFYKIEKRILNPFKRFWYSIISKTDSKRNYEFLQDYFSGKRL